MKIDFSKDRITNNYHLLQKARHYLVNFPIYIDFKAFKRIQRKLTNEDYKLLWMIISSFQKIERRQQSIGKAEKTNAKREKYYSLLKSEDEFKEMINKLNREYFCELLCLVVSIMASSHSKNKLSKLTQLQFLWTNEITEFLGKKKANRAKGKLAKELLSIAFNGRRDSHATGKNEESRMISDIEIDLERELDVSRLISGKYSFEIQNDIFCRIPKKVEEDNLIILENGRKLSLAELYEEWIARKANNPQANDLASKDLLENILIIYAIKKAQSDDPRAINLLVRCYEKKTRSLARKFLAEKRATYKGQDFSPYGILTIEDAEQVALYALHTLICGDDPVNLIKYIGKKPKEKPEPELMLNRKIDDIFLSSYESKIEDLSASIKKLRLADGNFRNKIKDLNYKKKMSKLEKRMYYCKKIILLSLEHLRKVDYIHLAVTSDFDSKSFIMNSRYFNKWAYRPTKNSNLTVWLFGEKNNKFRGLMWQKLNDWFRSKTYVQNGRRLIKKEDYTWLVNIDEFENPDKDEDEY